MATNTAPQPIDVKAFTNTELGRARKDLADYKKMKAAIKAKENLLTITQQQLLLNHKDKNCFTLGQLIEEELGQK